MGIIVLLLLLASRDRLAALYLVQALTCLGLSLAVLFVDRPVLLCALHVGSALVYGGIAVAHGSPVRKGQDAPGLNHGS
jgi:hypothetical protein